MKLCPWRTRTVLLALPLAVFSVVMPKAQADLAWAQKSVDVKANADMTTVDAHFRFTNRGTEAVEVRQVQTSCGCTTAALSQRHFAPGESGEIVASYQIGNRVGAQKASIQVLTDEGHEPVVLNLNVDIPEVLRIQPAFVRWTHGEAHTAKTITLEMMQDTPIKEIAVLSSNAAVTVNVKPLVEGRRYQLDITPAQTEQYLFATLTIRCKLGKEEKIFRAYATVSPPTADDELSAK